MLESSNHPLHHALLKIIGKRQFLKISCRGPAIIVGTAKNVIPILEDPEVLLQAGTEAKTGSQEPLAEMTAPVANDARLERKPFGHRNMILPKDGGALDLSQRFRQTMLLGSSLEEPFRPGREVFSQP